MAGVDVVTLHPHSTHLTQPVDVGLAGPFKTHLNSAIAAMRAKGHCMDASILVGCTKAAYEKTFAFRVDPYTGQKTNGNKEAWRKIGLVPWVGVSALPDSAYAKSDAILQQMQQSAPEVSLDVKPPDALAAAKDILAQPTSLPFRAQEMIKAVQSGHKKTSAVLTSDEWQANKTAWLEKKHAEEVDKAARSKAWAERRAAATEAKKEGGGVPKKKGVKRKLGAMAPRTRWTSMPLRQAATRTRRRPPTPPTTRASPALPSSASAWSTRGRPVPRRTSTWAGGTSRSGTPSSFPA